MSHELHDGNLEFDGTTRYRFPGHFHATDCSVTLCRPERNQRRYYIVEFVATTGPSFPINLASGTETLIDTWINDSKPLRYSARSTNKVGLGKAGGEKTPYR